MRRSGSEPRFWQEFEKSLKVSTGLSDGCEAAHSEISLVKWAGPG